MADTTTAKALAPIRKRAAQLRKQRDAIDVELTKLDRLEAALLGPTPTPTLRPVKPRASEDDILKQGRRVYNFVKMASPAEVSMKQLRQIVEPPHNSQYLVVRAIEAWNANSPKRKIKDNGQPKSRRRYSV